MDFNKKAQNVFMPSINANEKVQVTIVSFEMNRVRENENRTEMLPIVLKQKNGDVVEFRFWVDSNKDGVKEHGVGARMLVNDLAKQLNMKVDKSWTEKSWSELFGMFTGKTVYVGGEAKISEKSGEIVSYPSFNMEVINKCKEVDHV